ncbi:MAG: hypothetical protein JWQ41_2220, partial [Variovorax sp.]|nr:hypothetical protein [Variovorax sp.]
MTSRSKTLLLALSAMSSAASFAQSATPPTTQITFYGALDQYVN